MQPIETDFAPTLKLASSLQGVGQCSPLKLHVEYLQAATLFTGSWAMQPIETSRTLPFKSQVSVYRELGNAAH